MASYTSNDPFYKRTSDFLKWLRDRPGTTISRKIEITDMRVHNAGRGIGKHTSSNLHVLIFAKAPAVAVEDVEENEKLFTIAQSNVLTVQNSSLQQVNPHLLERLNSWNSLVLVMMFEDGLGEESMWWNYLRMLPTDFDTLMYWSSSELAELEGSAVLSKIKKDDADQSFKRSLLPIVQQHPELFGRHAKWFRGSDAYTVLLDIAHRMASLIMAYGFDIEKESGSSEEDDEEEADGSSQSAYELNKGMVPFADLFNADGDLNNAHLIQHEDGSMTMVALQLIQQGEQIYNDYGQLPRSDLLSVRRRHAEAENMKRRYGYVTDNYKKWDVVEIDVETVLSTVNIRNRFNDREQNARLELAAKWEVLQDGYDLNRPPEGIPFEFDQSLILTITAFLLDTDAAKQAISRKVIPNQPPLALLTTLGLVLKEIISHRLRAYKTTLSEDTALLENLSVQGRQRMAIEVRLGEKEILTRAALHVDKTIAASRRISDEGSSQIERRV